jgi:hypothetical protein
LKRLVEETAHNAPSKPIILFRFLVLRKVRSYWAGWKSKKMP